MDKNQIRDKVEKLVKELAGAQQVRTMYSQDHDLTRKSVNKLFYILEDLLFIKDEITIGIIGDEFAFEKEPFYDISAKIKGFIDHLKEIDALKISFLKGVSKEEITEFVGILAMNIETLNKTGGLEQRFESSNIKNIAFGKIGYRKKSDEDIIVENIANIAKRNFENGEDVLKEIAGNILESKNIDLSKIKSFVSGIMNNLLTNKSSLLILTAVKTHDEYSFVHNINVAIFSLLQAESLSLEQRYINEIGVAALLHDVGKLSIPGEILRKDTALTDEEFKIIKSHPVFGAKILLESPDINPLASIVAFEHHVRYNLSGYPERLFNDKTNLATMIVTISDVYDALRSKRAYAGEMAPEKTYEQMIEQSGRDFNEDLLTNFFNLIGVYPPGTLVELNTGEIGLVIKESALDNKRPQLEILYDNKGGVLKEPYSFNLLEKDPKTGEFKKTILHSIIPTEKFLVPEKYR